MARNNGDLLVRIDERVKTIFTDMKMLKTEMVAVNKRHNDCQINKLPQMSAEITSLKQRPIGATAFLIQMLKGVLR